MTRRAIQAKLWPAVEAVGDLGFSVVRCVFGVGVDDGGEGARGGLLVVDLGGVGVDGVDLHGHGQFVQVAVVEDAAAGSDLKGALLLLFGALHVFLVAHDLQPEEAACDGAGPEEKEETDEPEARALERDDAGRVVAAADGSNGWLHVEFQLLAF